MGFRHRGRQVTAPHPSLPKGERDQSIFTPQSILDAVTTVWPEGIALDPAWHPDSLVRPQYAITEAHDGLSRGWLDRTFVNPPFKTLQVWLDRIVDNGEACRHETIALIPLRSHRKWFAPVFRADMLAFLGPTRFHGYRYGFPAPLVVAYWGQRHDSFRAAFEPLSTKTM